MSKNELRGPRFRRLFPDIYVRVSPEPPDHATTSRAAFVLVERQGGVLGGYSAATLLGADCAPKDSAAEVIVPGDRRSYPGLRVRRGQVAGRDLWRAQGCLVTSPERTARDLARRLDLVEAVVTVDALTRVRVDQVRPFTPADLLRRKENEPGARGCRRLDRIVTLADPGAESPMETRLRLLLILAGLPKPVVQYKLHDEYGYVLARFDLAYPNAMLAIEYDGLGHARREFTNDDRWRDVTTGNLGWHTMRFGHEDVLTYPQRTIEAVRNMRERRLHLLAGTPTSTGEC